MDCIINLANPKVVAHMCIVLDGMTLIEHYLEMVNTDQVTYHIICESDQIQSFEQILLKNNEKIIFHSTNLEYWNQLEITNISSNANVLQLMKKSDSDSAQLLYVNTNYITTDYYWDFTDCYQPVDIMCGQVTLLKYISNIYNITDGEVRNFSNISLCETDGLEKIYATKPSIINNQDVYNQLLKTFQLKGMIVEEYELHERKCINNGINFAMLLKFGIANGLFDKLLYSIENYPRFICDISNDQSIESRLFLKRYQRESNILEFELANDIRIVIDGKNEQQLIEQINDLIFMELIDNVTKTDVPYLIYIFNNLSFTNEESEIVRNYINKIINSSVSNNLKKDVLYNLLASNANKCGEIQQLILNYLLTDWEISYEWTSNHPLIRNIISPVEQIDILMMNSNCQELYLAKQTELISDKSISYFQSTGVNTNNQDIIARYSDLRLSPIFNYGQNLKVIAPAFYRALNMGEEQTIDFELERLKRQREMLNSYFEQAEDKSQQVIVIDQFVYPRLSINSSLINHADIMFGTAICGQIPEYISGSYTVMSKYYSLIDVIINNESKFSSTEEIVTAYQKLLTKLNICIVTPGNKDIIGYLPQEQTGKLISALDEDLTNDLIPDKYITDITKLQEHLQKRSLSSEMVTSVTNYKTTISEHQIELGLKMTGSIQAYVSEVEVYVVMIAKFANGTIGKYRNRGEVSIESGELIVYKSFKNESLENAIEFIVRIEIEGQNKLQFKVANEHELKYFSNNKKRTIHCKNEEMLISIERI